MADRGGLNYTIQVVDKFSTALDLFVAKIATAQASWQNFGAAMVQTSAQIKAAAEAAKVASRQHSDAVKAQALAMRGLATATNRTATAQGKYATNTARLNEAQQNLSNTIGSNKYLLEQQEDMALNTAGAMQQLTNATRGTNSANRAFRRSLDRSKRGAKQYGDEAERAEKKTNKLGGALKKTRNAANRISFTFRRLIGILAAFTIARNIVGGFVSLVQNTIKFSSSIDDARMGISGVLVASRNISDEFGNILKPADALPVALKAANYQISELYKEAKNTSATFDELVEAFQSMVGATAGTGISLNQSRKLTVMFSQAATALRIPQNQLDEEIRSVISGTARALNTRLVRAFGMSSLELNEAIRKATKEGRLFEFLEESLAGFEAMSKASLNTFNVLVSNAADALYRLTSTGAGQFIEELKESLRAVIDLSLDDNFGINPTALAAVQQIFDGLGDVVKTIRESLQSLTADQIVSFFTTLAGTFRVLAAVAGGFIRGFMSGLDDILKVIKPVTDYLFKSSDTIENIVAKVTRLATIAVAVQGTMNVWKTTSAAFKTIMAAASANMKTLLMRVVVLPALLLGAFHVLEKFGSALAGVPLEFSDIMKIVASQLQSIGSQAMSIGEDFLAFMGYVGKEIYHRFMAHLKLVGVAIDQLAGKLTAGKWGSKNTFKEDYDAATKAEDLRQQAALKSFEVRANIRKKERELARIDHQGTLDNIMIEGQRRRRDGIATKNLFEKLQGSMDDIVETGLDNMFGLIDTKAARSNALIKGVEEALLAAQAASDVAPGQISEKDENTYRRTLDVLREQNNVFEKQLGLRAKARMETLEADLIGANSKTIEIRRLQLQRESLVTKQQSLEIARQQELNLLKRLQAYEDMIRLETQYEQEARITTAQVKKLTAEIERLKLTSADATVFDGMEEGFLRVQESAKTTAEISADFVESAISGLSSEISGALVAAFDPTEPINALERLARVMQRVAQMVIDELVRMAIAKAVFSGGTSAAGGVTTTQGPQQWDFGSQYSTSGGPAGSIFAGLRPGGFAEGGQVPEAGAGPFTDRSGVDPRDIVPAWLRPHEWVIRPESVRKYGSAVMNAINRGLVDPMSLKSMVGARRHVATARRTSSARGFATGGPVGAAARSAAPAPSPSVGVSRTVVVSDEQSFDRMLTGGRRALMKFMTNNRAEINSALGIGSVRG